MSETTERSGTSMGPEKKPSGVDHDATVRREVLREQMQQALVPLLLERWYPRVMDEEFGGFYSRLSLDFEVTGTQRKLLVPQARHVWTTSKASELLPDDLRYRQVADHGFRYLRDVMWDRANGGFFEEVYTRSAEGVWPTSVAQPVNLVSRLIQRIPRNRVTRAAASILRRGRVRTPRRTTKTAYGQAFAIYALAAFFRSTERVEALELAREAFRWLETHAHDSEHGGYMRLLDQDGTPAKGGPNSRPPKDFDSTLHLVEAFTELYGMWPDDLVRRRLEELIGLVRDRMISKRGTGWVTFARDWTPVCLTEEDVARRDFEFDHVSFGHDIEMAALLIDACEVLGLTGETAFHTTAKRLADHSLEYGRDREHGGLFMRGYYFVPDDGCSVVDHSKIYWVQAETLNTLSMMRTLYPDDPRDYSGLFEAQWQYCHDYMVDHQRGGWYWQGLDALAEADQPGKSTPVTATYHVGRALMNCLKRLG